MPGFTGEGSISWGEFTIRNGQCHVMLSIQIDGNAVVLGLDGRGNDIGIRQRIDPAT
jgi:hypothetical protein